jgi:hypothetical protein
MDHLYIRHTLGGTLFYDSKQDGNGYELEFVEGNWIFKLSSVAPTAVQELLAHSGELNIFLVAEGQTAHKSWLYSTEGRVEADAASGLVLVYADVRQDYTV